MIESIKISNVATFCEADVCDDTFSLINFIYGSNGSGKTTISRIIANEENYPDCKVKWTADLKLIPMVYNRDFIENNFSQPSELKGVFTLGEENIDIENQIADVKREIDQINSNITKHKETLNGKDHNKGKYEELEQHDEEFKEKCWEQKLKHYNELSSAFKGFMGDKGKFRDNVLKNFQDNNANLETLEQLVEKAKTVYGPTLIVESNVKPIDMHKLCEFESDLMLLKKIIGKKDVDISAMISKLENSDWVREGRSYFDINNGICPFCQQSTKATFANSLAEYFDETFEAETSALNDIKVRYSNEVNRVQRELDDTIANHSKYLDLGKLKSEKLAFDSTCALNLQSLSNKIKEPSRIVTLAALAGIASNIDAVIKQANAQIDEHNKIANNIIKEKETLTAQVWKYIVKTELKADIEAYLSKKSGLKNAISNLNEKIGSLTTEKNQKEATLQELEKSTTSIQPTITEINGILSSFGFHNFSLAMTECGACYKLIRADGSDAKETLSEGEKSFVTFLYFYCLLKGSNSNTSITADRVVVFDDPVSSLDSEILYIVSSLIKNLIKNSKDSIGTIKQIFILTHNVYFHKEVTFQQNAKRNRQASGKESFWVVRKVGDTSKIEKRPTNPITTSYDLLWDEIRKRDRSVHSIQNTMRRILEYYFKIMGGFKEFDLLCDKFEGNDKFICSSLISWIHAGSHFPHDDVFMTVDESMVDKYLDIFKGIFEKSNHISHYDMMMGNETE